MEDFKKSPLKKKLMTTFSIFFFVQRQLSAHYNFAANKEHFFTPCWIVTYVKIFGLVMSNQKIVVFILFLLNSVQKKLEWKLTGS